MKCYHVDAFAEKVFEGQPCRSLCTGQIPLRCTDAENRRRKQPVRKPPLP